MHGYEVAVVSSYTEHGAFHALSIFVVELGVKFPRNLPFFVSEVGYLIKSNWNNQHMYLININYTSVSLCVCDLEFGCRPDCVKGTQLHYE